MEEKETGRASDDHSWGWAGGGQRENKRGASTGQHQLASWDVRINGDSITSLRAAWN